MAQAKLETAAQIIADPDSWIQPLVRVKGEKHIFEQLFEQGKLPELKAVGYIQAKPGNNWVSYTMTIRGREIIKMEVAEPDLREIAEETAKINFVQELVDQTPW